MKVLKLIMTVRNLLKLFAHNFMVLVVSEKTLVEVLLTIGGIFTRKIFATIIPQKFLALLHIRFYFIFVLP